jgi:allophanate hydrolase subunit 2
VIRVVSVAGMCTVQDGGRPGHLHEGVPPGGALVPELLARANVAAGNEPWSAALELFGVLSLTADAATLVAADDGVKHELDGGAPWTLACGPARVRYLAVRGGIDVPRVLGGRGTLLSAGLGGHEGRPLRRGDTLHPGSAPMFAAALPPPPDPASPVLVVVGPDVERFAPGAVDVLLSSSFVVDALGDRTGIRLRGPALLRHGGDADVSAPMVRGAVQVPLGGQPIVLGPDHPTIGGYPVLATVTRASFGGLAMRTPGSAVRFAVLSSAAP